MRSSIDGFYPNRLQKGKPSWENYSIASLARPLRPEELREALRADALIAKLQAHQKTAELALASPDLAVRIRCGEQFRELFGFDASMTEAVKDSFAAIRRGTGQTVEGILRPFQPAKGSEFS